MDAIEEAHWVISGIGDLLRELQEENRKIQDENLNLREQVLKQNQILLQLKLDRAFNHYDSAGPHRSNRPKLSKADANDIRAAYHGGAKQKDLAEKYRVNPATISRIVQGVYY